MGELPSGTVTFLFTDLEGSTRLWQEHPVEMRPALARHDELVRGAVEAHDGYVVKTTGDGVHAAFPTAATAIAAAVDAQLAIGAEPWPLPAPLRVRMGIHSGPAELRDGDYYGTAVNKSARIMSVGHGGQILLSTVADELARGDGVETLDLGAHRLKDLAEAERIFQVVHPDLEREFPPLRSLERFASNLPIQATSFVGRDEDVARVVSLLDEARLVTLAGTGGVGKTRLSLQVAAEVGARFADGVWVCELAVARDAETMAQVIATTLGCVQHPGLSMVASIVEYVKVREVLLVLDNCEHLLDDVADLAADVLRAAPRVVMLATSREGLDVPGEQVVRLRSLATPPESASNSGELEQSPAVQLFRDRAQEAGSDVDWDAQQWSAVAEVCRRVDGIPLAIELAAARTVSMRPVDLARHLDERFRLLTGQRRGRVERHQTLRATVEWSYQLLADDERTVFDRLGTFPGSFDESAAVAVGGDDDLDPWTVTDALASLVAKSMLGTEAGPAGSTRYRMLETLRHYAREQLDVIGGADATDRCRRGHARHMATVARDAGAGVDSPEELRWFEQVRTELDNFRAAALWALDSDVPADRELGLSILAPLARIAMEANDLGISALARPAVSAALDAEPETRTLVLALASQSYWLENEVDEARRLAQLATAEGVLTDSLHPFMPYMALVPIEVAAGNYAGALAAIDEIRPAIDTAHDEYQAAYALQWIANLEGLLGRVDEARADAERVMQTAQRLGSPSMLAAGYHALAWASQRNDPDAALDAAEHCIAIQRATGVQRGTQSGALSLAAGLRARRGDDPGALELLHDALALARDDGTMPQAAAALTYAVRPLRHLGRDDAAAVFVGAMERGVVAGVAKFPGMQEGNARALARIRDALGNDKTDELVERGGALDRDELFQFALAVLRDPTMPAT